MANIHCDSTDSCDFCTDFSCELNPKMFAALYAIYQSDENNKEDFIVSDPRHLYKIFRMQHFKDIEVFQDGNRVNWSGNFSLPRAREFDTPEEAKAFIDGMIWAVNYYNGDVTQYMK